MSAFDPKQTLRATVLGRSLPLVLYRPRHDILSPLSEPPTPHDQFKCVSWAGSYKHVMSSLWKTPVLGPLIFSVWRADARRKLELAAPWMAKTDRLLEVGSGPGSVLVEFRNAGFQVEALDVTDTSYSKSLAPTLYDGRRMPYPDDAFDTALLLTVLHHTPEPDEILRETARVARRVIILEDVYEGAWQRKYTKVADSITNLEFFGHPHSNRSDPEWRDSFARLGLTLLHGEVHPFAVAFQQALYVVEKQTALERVSAEA